MNIREAPICLPKAADRSLVDGLLLELRQQVAFDLNLLHLRRLRSPVPLAEGKITVPNKPSEGSRTVLKDSATSKVLARLFGDFSPQSVARLGLGHLGPEVE